MPKRTEKVLSEREMQNFGVYHVWCAVKQRSESAEYCRGCKEFYAEAHRRTGEGCRRALPDCLRETENVTNDE